MTLLEGVYADFGYPEDMRGFVRYTPGASGEAQLMANWEAYLESARQLR